MHLLEIVTDKARMQPSPCATSDLFLPTEVEQAATMEIHGTSFADPGQDFCLFILKDKDGRKIVQRRVEGF